SRRSVRLLADRCPERGPLELVSWHSSSATAAIRRNFRRRDQKGQNLLLRLLPGSAPAQQLTVHRRDLANSGGGWRKYGRPSPGGRSFAEPIHLRFPDGDLPFAAASRCPEAAQPKRFS